MTISKVVLASVLVSILVLHLVQAEQLDKDLQTDSKASGEEINKIDCGGACAARCRLSSRPRLCKRACGTCCARCNCVPPGTSGNEDVCPCYANMTTHGNKHKCP